MYHPVISYQDHVYYRYDQNTVRGCNFTRNFREKSSLRRNSSQNIRAVFSSYFIMSLIGFAFKTNVTVMIVRGFFMLELCHTFIVFCASETSTLTVSTKRGALSVSVVKRFIWKVTQSDCANVENYATLATALAQPKKTFRTFLDLKTSQILSGTLQAYMKITFCCAGPSRLSDLCPTQLNPNFIFRWPLSTCLRTGWDEGIHKKFD